MENFELEKDELDYMLIFSYNITQFKEFFCSNLISDNMFR